MNKIQIMDKQWLSDKKDDKDMVWWAACIQQLPGNKNCTYEASVTFYIQNVFIKLHTYVSEDKDSFKKFNDKLFKLCGFILAFVDFYKDERAGKNPDEFAEREWLNESKGNEITFTSYAAYGKNKNEMFFTFGSCDKSVRFWFDVYDKEKKKMPAWNKKDNEEDIAKLLKVRTICHKVIGDIHNLQTAYTEKYGKSI